MKKVLSILVWIVLIAILFVNSVILISSLLNKDEVPSFFGWKPFITLSGSMQSEIYAGDLAIVKEVDPDELKEGDVIAFRQGDIVITHRIERIIEENGEKQFITKGDNNNFEDVYPVYPNMIEGKFEFKIAKLGNVAIFIQTPMGTAVALAIPVILFILIQINGNKDKDKELKEKELEQEKMKKELERLKEENKKLSEKV